MKVLLIIDNNPYIENSASANRYLTLIEGICSFKEVELNMIVLKDNKNNFDKLRGNFVFPNNLLFTYLKSINNDTIWQRRWNVYVGKYYQDLNLTTAIKEQIKILQPDIVWTSSSLLSFQLTYKLKKLFPQIPFFVEMSEFLDIYRHNKGNVVQRILARKRERFFEQKAIKVYDGMALMTKTLLNHYQNFAIKPKLLHLPMTVDLERFSQKPEPPEAFIPPYIAFVGVMNDAKDGVNILIESFAKIASQYADLNLYLVGSWNYDTPHHLKRITELKLTERIKWMGEFPRDAIPSIIMNAKLLVLPRPASKQAQGGFPTKLGEYLATGIPVCATTVGELSDYLTDNYSVFFAEPGSIDSFTEAMHSALQDDECAFRIGQKGKEVAQTHFNKNIQAQKLITFLKDLAK